MVWGVLVWFGVFWGDSMDPCACPGIFVYSGCSFRNGREERQKKREKYRRFSMLQLH